MKLLPRLVSALCLLLFSVSYSVAQYNVEIVAGNALSNISLAGTTFNPTANDATIGVDTLVSLLNGNTVTINTNTGGAQAGSITVSAALQATGPGNVLILNAEGNIILNQDLNNFDSFESFAAFLDAGGDIIAPSNSINTGGGNIDLNAIGTISINAVNASSSGLAGNITVFSGGDFQIGTGSISANGGGSGAGDITMTIGGTLSAGVSPLAIFAEDQSGGNFSINAFEITTPLDLSFSGPAGGGGNVDITTTGPALTTIQVIDVSGSSASGFVALNVGGPLTVTPNINMSTAIGSGQQFSATAVGNITLGNIDTSSDGNGGPIIISSTSGSISTGDLIADAFGGVGGAVTLSALNTISVGVISSQPNVGGDGGAVDIFSEAGDILFTSINTQSNPGNGGNIDISAFGAVIGSGSFTALNSEFTTISTISGAATNGTVFISHNVDNPTDFEVGLGAPPTNGLFGDLGADTLVVSDNFLNDLNSPIVGGNYSSGDNRITILSPSSPIITEAIFSDVDQNGNLDQVRLIFDQPVDIGDSGVGADGLDAIEISYGPSVTLDNADYNASGITQLDIDFIANEIPGTGVSGISVSYVQGGSSFIASAEATEVANAAIPGLITDSANPVIVSASTNDVDANGQIDLITVLFSEDLDGATVTDGGAEFTIAGYPILATALNGTNGVDLTLTESGSPDKDLTPDIDLIAATLSDLSGNFNDAILFTSTVDSAGPVLSGLDVYQIGLDNYSVFIENDESVDFYFVTTISGVQPTATQIINGQDDGGAVAPNFGLINSVGPGIQNYGIGGTSWGVGDIALNEGTSYFTYWVAVDSAGNVSNTVSLPFSTPTPTDVTFTTIDVPSFDLQVGSIDNHIYTLEVAVATADAITQGIYYGVNGTYDSINDFVIDGFKLWLNTVNDFSTATQIGTASFDRGGITPEGDIAWLYSDTLFTGNTYYFFVSADISAGANVGNFFNLTLATDSTDNVGIQDFKNKIDGGLVDGNTFSIAAAVGELLTNGDFETGTGDSWSGNALNVIDDGGNFVNFADITVAGNSFDVNLSQVVEIVQGQDYRLSFDAFSNVNRTMVVGIGLNETPFNSATETISLDTFNQSYSIPLFAADFGIPNSRVLFDMGAEVGQVTIDNVSLVEVLPFESDSLALVALYDSTNGDGWTNNTNWKTGPVNTWFGVTVVGDRVVDLSLSSNNLSGTIPVAIGSLDSISSLDLSFNSLAGGIPIQLGSLINLTSLSLGSNSLNGIIPEELYNLVNLTSLDISNNNTVTGAISTSIGNLSSLQSLYLNNNALTDSIPIEISGLLSLTQLDLSTNSLSGTLPIELGNLVNLSVLRIADNQFTGVVPNELVNLTALSELRIYNNDLSGLPDLSALTGLSMFDVFNNRFTFEDLEPNATIITDVVDQQNFGSPQFPSFFIGDSLSLDALLPGTGGSDSYQWQQDGIDIPGANAISYNKPIAEVLDAGTYRLKVTNSSFPGLEIFSENISLTVRTAPDPALVDALADSIGKVWKIAQSAGAFKIGPAPNDGTFFSNTIDDLTLRDCYFDDTYTFFDDGTFVIDIQGQTFVEAWQGDEFLADACDDPSLSTLNDYSLLAGGTFSYELFNSDTANLKINGKGAYIGLPKAYNGGEYSSTLEPLRDSVIYEVFSYSEGSLVLTIDIGSNIWWTFTLSSPLPPTNETDSLALIALYDSTNGDGWTNNANWKTGPVNTWYGVTVENTRVTEISLYGSTLENFDGNNLSGPIPAQLADLTELRVLDLGLNNLTGSIPPELGSLANLQFLNLPCNNGAGLTGGLPPELGNLTSLIQIEVAGNDLSGAIPPEFGNMTSLATLGLSSNELSGSIPAELGDLPSIGIMNLSINKLSGAVPTNFNQLTALDELYIRENQLVDLPDLSNLTQLSFFDVSFNRFGADDINPNLGVITNNEGQIVPVIASDSTALVDIYNSLGGPNWTGGQTWLTDTLVALWEGVIVSGDRVISLDINGFGASGDVPPSLGNLDALQTFGAANNELTGLPEEIGLLSNLRSLYLDGNLIQGSLPLGLGNLSNLEEMFIQGNRFSGSLPDTLGNLSSLRSLWISENELSGQIPSSLGALSSLESLNLSDNRIEGALPETITNLTALVSLQLANNRISAIPVDYSGMGSLFEIDLSFNDLDSISPSTLIPGSLARFDVRGNALNFAPDLSGLNLNDYNVENNRIPFANLLSLSNTSGLGGQNYRYPISVDNLLPATGQDVTISLTSDDANNTFQWYKNGAPIDGEISPSLAIVGLTEEDEGVYHAEVGNSLLSGVFTFSEQFELEFGVTSKEYGSAVADASSSLRLNIGSPAEAIGFPNSYNVEDGRGWRASDTDSIPSLTLEVQEVASFNTLWMSVNKFDGNWFSTISYSMDGTNFTSLPIGFSIPYGPGGNLYRWDFETIIDSARFIKVEFDAAQVNQLNLSIDALAIGSNNFSVNRPQNLALSASVNDTIINVGWSGSGFGDGVIVERATGNNAFQVIDTTFTSFGNAIREPFSYSDRTVPAVADSVYYRVRAFQGGASSDYSNILEILRCETLLNTDFTWSGDADPNGFTGVTSPQPDIFISAVDESTYSISDISGGYMDFVGIGFEYYPIEANFSFDCNNGISFIEFLNAPGVGCGGDLNLVLDSAMYYPGNDSLVFHLQWPSCGETFTSYFKLGTNPIDRSAPIQDPAIARFISQPQLDKIEITWQDVNEGEEFYIIERSVDNTSSFGVIDSVSALNNDEGLFGTLIGSYIDNDISGGSTFYYRLITRNSAGDSDYSDTLSITKQGSTAFERVLSDPVVTDLPNATYAGYWGDYDSDGDPDLYVQNWQKGSDPVFRAPNNYFYDNNGDGTFSKTTNSLTAKATQSRAGSWGDLDNDGDLDFVLPLNQNEINTQGAFLFLYENNNGEFIERVLGEPISGGFDHVVLADYDNDGLVDVLAKSYIYFNEGGLTFTETSYTDLFPEKTGASEPFAHAVDVDNDLDLDIYFGGDNATFLYINNGDRTFTLSSELSSPELGHRGGAWGDFDNDGDFDLFFSQERKPVFGSLRFYRNDGGVFQLLGPADIGLDTLNLQRGGTAFDYNNDGLLDLVTYENSTGNPIILENTGSNQFAKITDPSFAPINTFVSGVSVADFDNDGNQDFFIASGFSSNQSNFLYKNSGNTNNYLKVDLRGTTSNYDGIGAIIRVVAAAVPQQVRQVSSINGTWSGNELTAHFGLGTATTVDSVEVIWPSGQRSFVTNVAANQTIEVLELAIPDVKIDSLVTNAFQPAITGTISDTLATLEIELESTIYAATINGDSTWVIAAGVVDSLFNGQYQVIARATNAAGVGIDTAILVIDQRPPMVSVDTLIVNERSPELTGTVNDTTAIVSIEIDKDIYMATTNADSTWTLPAGSIDPPLEDGTYDVRVIGENDFGISSDSTTNELSIDATAPTLFVDNIGTSVTSPELTGFIDDFAASFTVNVEGRGDFTPAINTADSTWSIAAGTIDPPFTEADSPILIVATAEDSLFNISIDSGELVIANSIIALKASRITTNAFRANWSAVLDAVNYNLEVARDAGFTEVVASVDTLTTSYRVEGIDFETDYFYRVTFDNGVDAPTTSNTISLRTLIKPETVADFNALLAIRDATGATVNWDLGVRKQEWEAIELVSGRVVDIDLSANTLSNTFPLRRSLTELTDLNISSNSLEGIEDLSKLRSIENLNVSDNLFDFGDLEPLAPISALTYSPQKTRFSFNETLNADSLLIRVNTDTTLSLTTSGEYDRYQWFLGNQGLQTNDDFIVNDSTLRIQTIGYDNMGKFRAEVTNDSLPDLTLPVDSMFVFAVADFSVDVNDSDGVLIPDNVDGFLLLTEQRGSGFDTLSVARNQSSAFTFSDVILGDYLISIDADREKYVPTYYANAFEWTQADTVLFRRDSSFQLSMTIIPVELTADDGEGVLSVIIEEDFGDENARVDARRRAARRKCGLKKQRSGGRVGQDDDQFDLIAYGETNDNGEFEFGFLPNGVYRFFVEYPGIPLDESAFVQFEVGEAGISDTEFKLEAFVTEDGIQASVERVLGVIFEYFKNLQVYPNPARDVVKIAYRHLKADNVKAQLTDLAGNIKWTHDIRQGYDGYLEIDVSDYSEGIYMLHVYDAESRDRNVVSYRIIVRD